MGDALPLWPPLVALGLGLIALAWINWESRRFDKEFPPESYMDDEIEHKPGE